MKFCPECGEPARWKYCSTKCRDKAAYRILQESRGPTNPDAAPNNNEPWESAVCFWGGTEQAAGFMERWDRATAPKRPDRRRRYSNTA